ncbi:MAG: hypothetical protein SGI88_06135 [Candidatus Hydrogenedentes bacterium]|nr:hypothetical protein [Candidatus Hydrogenedentota bacterium]
MRRQQIIAILVVLLLAGGAGAGYQFYFKPALEKFSEKKQYLADLNTKLTSLKRTFPKSKPEAAVAEAKAKIQPWQEALELRARQFSVADFKDFEPLPETRVLKAYYATTSLKLVQDLYTETITKQVWVNPAVDMYFGMPRPDSLQGKTVHPLEALYWLSNIKFGGAVLRLLMDSDVLGIDDLHMWTPKTTKDGFTNYPIGVSMWMTMDGFCRLIEKLQEDDSMAVTVQGFSITNNALRAYTDPPLKIQMVFRIDEYVPDAKPLSAIAPPAAGGRPGAAAPPAAPGAVGIERLAAMQQIRNTAGGSKPASGSEESFWQKFWPF